MEEVTKVKIDLIALEIENLGQKDKLDALRTLENTLSLIYKNFDSSILKSSSLSTLALEEISATETESKVKIQSKYFCEICSIDLGNGEKFRRHRNIHSGQFKCNLCEKVFHDSYAVKRHQNNKTNCLEMPTRTKRDGFPCGFCRYRAQEKEDVKKHMVSMHPQRLSKFRCNKCSYQYYRMSYLEAHLRKCK